MRIIQEQHLNNFTKGLQERVKRDRSLIPVLGVLMHPINGAIAMIEDDECQKTLEDDDIYQAAAKSSIILLKYPHPGQVTSYFEHQEKIDTEDVKEYVKTGECDQHVVHIWCDDVSNMDNERKRHRLSSNRQFSSSKNIDNCDNAKGELTSGGPFYGTEKLDNIMESSTRYISLNGPTISNKAARNIDQVGMKRYGDDMSTSSSSFSSSSLCLDDILQEDGLQLICVHQQELRDWVLKNIRRSEPPSYQYTFHLCAPPVEDENNGDRRVGHQNEEKEKARTGATGVQAKGKAKRAEEKFNIASVLESFEFKPITKNQWESTAKHWFPDYRKRLLKPAVMYGSNFGAFTKEKDQKLVGYVSLLHTGAMGALVVLPDYRDHGIGAALLYCLYHYLRSNGLMTYAFAAQPRGSFPVKLGMEGVEGCAIHWIGYDGDVSKRRDVSKRDEKLNSKL